MSESDIGTKAPDFSLPRDGGGTVSLGDFRGKKLVLYFYPKDDTSSCTREAIDFTALIADFNKAGTAVVGVSPDSAKRHDKFAAKHGLGVILASDEDTATIKAYDVWKEKQMYGRKYMGVERSTFLIGPDGTILKAWRNVRVAGHAAEVLEAAKAA
jgi:Peroxiredoxin